MIRGKVARKVTGDELIINLGRRDGVRVGQEFDILDDRTSDVLDPDTKEPLGSIRRVKHTVIVRQVEDRLSLARARSLSLGFGAISSMFEPRGQAPDLLTDVSVGDVVEEAPRKSQPATS